MELKNLHRDIKAAFEENLADYKDTVPHLFHHNVFIILGNGVEAKIGSLSSQFAHFNDWKRLSEGEVGVVDHDKDPCRANSGEHLQQLLREQKAYVFSLVQKFNQAVAPDAPYTQRDDIIVITDEAHRTQYGLLSLNMRNALPNASFIGFTGTPLFADDEITQEVFGEYVSTYDFQRAVEDKSTVPLYYDARGEKLVFKDEDGAQHSVADPKGLNEKIAAKLAELEIDDIDVQQRLERELKRDYHLITSSSRLGQIAEDFVQHYSQGWETGKAMLVCIDKITCVLKLVNALSAEEKRAQREHLNEETLALFDLLQKPDLKSKERERIKQVAA